MLTGVAVSLASVISAVRNARRGEVTVRLRGERLTLTSAHLRGYVEIEFVRRTERALLTALLAEVDSDTVVYDVGANVGFYACLLGTVAGSVHAFEPNPHAVADLRRNVARNGLDTVHVHDAAVSDVSGSGYLTGCGWPNGRSELTGRPTGVRVERVALDDLATEPPDVVKIDVEGHERAVLSGMSGLMESHPPVILCELHGTGADVTELLRSRGYAVERFDSRFDGNVFVRASVTE